jgi:hypothetical protein
MCLSERICDTPEGSNYLIPSTGVLPGVRACLRYRRRSHFNCLKLNPRKVNVSGNQHWKSRRSVQQAIDFGKVGRDGLHLFPKRMRTKPSYL